MNTKRRLEWVENALMFVCVIFTAFGVFNDFQENGWHYKTWILVVILACLLVFNLIRLLNRNTLLEFFAQNSHVVDVHPNGKVVLKGHRISLFQFMKEMNKPPDQLTELYPTVDSDLLRSVLELCEENSKQLEVYVKRERRLEQIADRLIENRRAGLTLDGLRNEMKSREGTA